MEHCVKITEPWGRVLWLTDGNVQVGVALDFGIRVVHLSCVGMENLFYVQPADGSDGVTRDNGWRVHGGHRFWVAPESEANYTPDNDPVEYTVSDGVAWVTQKPDEQLSARKSVGISFCDGVVRIEHKIENLAKEAQNWALWGINTLAGGGVAEIPFPTSGDGYTPCRTVALWKNTNLSDPRLCFDKESLTVRHSDVAGSCKVGLGLSDGTAVLHSKGQKLELAFAVDPTKEYADCGSNFEVFMNEYFLELETLGPKQWLQPGQTATHVETWKLQAE